MSVKNILLISYSLLLAATCIAAPYMYGVYAILLSVTCVALLLRYYKGINNILIFDGLTIFLAFFIFYFVLRPGDYLFVRYFIPVKPIFLRDGLFSYDFLSKSMAMSIIGLVSFLIGYFCVYNDTIISLIKKGLRGVTYGIRKTSISVSVLSMLLVYLVLSTQWRVDLFANIFLVLFGMCFFFFAQKNTRASVIIVVLLFLACVIYYAFVRTERRDMFKIFYLLTAYYGCLFFYKVRSLKKRNWKIFALVLVMLLITVHLCLFVPSFKNCYGGYSFKQLLLLQNYFNAESITQLHDDLILNLDFPIVYDDYAYLVNKVPRESAFLMGKTYAKFFLFMIPRTAWPDKPETASREFLRVFFPRVYDTGMSRNQTMIGEMYWNFGYAGVVVGMFLFGFCLRSLDSVLHYYIKARRYVGVVFVMILISYQADIFRGGLFTDCVNIFFSILCIPLILSIAVVLCEKALLIKNR